MAVEHRFVETNGIRVHCAVDGDGPLVIFLHGFPECWYSWRHQIAALAPRFRVVAPDLRGYNESDKPKGVAAYALPELVADVHGLIEAFGGPDARGGWPHWLARFLYGDRPPPEATRTLDDWPKISAPTLLVWAEADVALGKELTLGMEPLFRGPLEIKYVPLSGHWVQQEQPELVNGYLLDFLGDLAPGHAGAPLFPA